MRQTERVTDTAKSPEAAEIGDYQLADRYRAEEGRVFLSGVQAIARLPIDQIRIDRRHGLDTAAFVSGYQGSPVGMFGEEVEPRAHQHVVVGLVAGGAEQPVDAGGFGHGNPDLGDEHPLQVERDDRLAPVG